MFPPSLQESQGACLAETAQRELLRFSTLPGAGPGWPSRAGTCGVLSGSDQMDRWPVGWPV